MVLQCLTFFTFWLEESNLRQVRDRSEACSERRNNSETISRTCSKCLQCKRKVQQLRQRKGDLLQMLGHFGDSLINTGTFFRLLPTSGFRLPATSCFIKLFILFSLLHMADISLCYFTAINLRKQFKVQMYNSKLTVVHI